MAAGLVDHVQVTLFPVITGQTGAGPRSSKVRPTSTWSWSRTGRSTVTSKSSATDPPSIDLYGYEEDPSCLHPFMHPTRADVNEARPLDWRPQRRAPCQPDGLSPAATGLATTLQRRPSSGPLCDHARLGAWMGLTCRLQLGVAIEELLDGARPHVITAFGSEPVAAEWERMEGPTPVARV
jgi:hypothetical protein